MTDLKIKGLAHIEYGVTKKIIEHENNWPHIKYGVTKKIIEHENNWHDWGDELGVISGVLQNG
jgi:hypothetical protein